MNTALLHIIFAYHIFYCIYLYLRGKRLCITHIGVYIFHFHTIHNIVILSYRSSFKYYKVLTRGSEKIRIIK